MFQSVAELIEKARQDDKIGETTSSRYVSTSMREDIDRTYAYLHSKHISGETDHLGREKPFFNIVLAVRNIWFRATDIDCKDVKVRADKSSNEIAAFLTTLKLQEWMKKNNFAKFLNDWGLSLATHGSAIVEFVEKGKDLHCSVLNWNDVYVDPINFDSGLVIKRLWYTPSELRKQKNYDKELVKKLLDNLTARTTSDGQKKDNKEDYIEVFEVHGELSLAHYKQSKGEEIEDGDEDKFFQQMHVVTLLERKDDGTDSEQYTLFSGKESKKPHMITHLLNEEGLTYVGGAVKNSFQAQWMVNHSAKQIKDQLDLASKIIFQTADPSFAGQNALVNIDNGDVLTFDGTKGQGLTQVNNKPDIGAMQSNKSDWQNQANQINGIAESMISQAKSGTAWRQTQAELQEAHSLFEIMTENKGNYVIQMLREYVIPFFKKQLNNSDEISGILENNQIKQIDTRYIPNEAIRRVNQKKKDTILSGQVYDPGMEAMDMQSAMQEIQGSLSGNQRFIKPSELDDKTWKDVLEDVLDGMEDNLDIDVTGESKDIQGTMASLDTAMKMIIGLQGRPMTEDEKFLYNRILSLSGSVSPLELSMNQSQPQPVAMPQPAAAQVQ